MRLLPVTLVVLAIVLFSNWSAKIEHADGMRNRLQAWLQHLDHLNKAQKLECANQEAQIRKIKIRGSLSGFIGLLLLFAAFVV